MNKKSFSTVVQCVLGLLTKFLGVIFHFSLSVTKYFLQQMYIGKSAPIKFCICIFVGSQKKEKTLKI